MQLIFHLAPAYLSCNLFISCSDPSLLCIKIKSSPGKITVENNGPFYIMPVLNGYETIKKLNHSWPGIKIMVFSMSIVKGVNDTIWGADAVISKAEGITELSTAWKLLIEVKLSFKLLEK